RQKGRTYTYRRYICGRYNSHGSAGCTCNTVAERPLANVLLRKIRDDFLKPSNLENLRAELRAQIETNEAPDKAEDLRKQADRLEAKIKQGTENYLAAPASLRAIIGKTLNQWQAKLDALEKAIERATPAPTPRNIDNQVDRAMARATSLLMATSRRK